MAFNYSPKIVTDGLVLYLDAANTKSYIGSGTTWTDLSRYGNNGTLVNMGSTGFSSSNGGVIVFDGIDDYVNSNFGVSNNNSFTVSFWMYYLSDGGTRGIITTWDTSWNGFGIAMVNSNLRSWTNNGAAGGMNWVSHSTISNVWSHVTLTYDYTTKTQSGYINGVFRISETLGTTITHSTLQVGRGGQTSSSQLSNYPYSNFRISNLFIYNRALSASEVLQNYNTIKSRFGLT
jgi:hypothetical protein